MKRVLISLLSLSFLSIAISAGANPKFAAENYLLSLPANWTASRHDDYTLITNKSPKFVCQVYLLKSLPVSYNSELSSSSDRFSAEWKKIAERGIFNSQIIKIKSKNDSLILLPNTNQKQIVDIITQIGFDIPKPDISSTHFKFAIRRSMINKNMFDLLFSIEYPHKIVLVPVKTDRFECLNELRPLFRGMQLK